MKSLLVLSLLFFSLSAFALKLPNQLNADEREQFTHIFGLTTSPKLLSNPYPLGGFSGFEFGLSIEYINIEELTDLDPTAINKDFYSFSRLSFSKGVYHNFDFQLSFTPFIGQNEMQEFGGSLKWSFYQANFTKGKLMVALNPRVALAVFGDQPYTRINMDEVRKLKGGPARILHQRLCAIISQGQRRKILPDTLISYIWPDPIEGAAKRKRLMTLRKALAEIVATGAWEVEPGYFIKRKGDFPKKKAAKAKT